LLPIKDLNKTLSTPHVNRLLLITNILIFTVYWLSSMNSFFDTQIAGYFEQHFVMIPNQILNGQRLYTLFTSMFMHASWLHLLGNMLYLYVFGDNVEEVFGHVGYFIFYIVSGLAAAYAYTLITAFAPVLTSLTGIPIPSDLTIGLLGASGAISGVLGAYLVLYPKAMVLTFVLYVLIPIPAILFLGIWFLLQWLYGVFDAASGVAYYAHIGGFIIGMILASTIGLRRKKALKARHRL
jgi:membrane associated rhomboid family serine protease